MIKASYQAYTLNFKRPSGTSRGVLTQKQTYFLKLSHNAKVGIGECGLLKGLSIDDRPDYEAKLQWLCENIHLTKEELLLKLVEFPSIQFGLEMALKSLAAEDPFLLNPSKFTSGEASIPINGLIWMGERSFMKDQIEEKLEAGFSCIKLKIGAIDFSSEIDLLSYIRSEYDADTIEIRVDANGAFLPEKALEKLKILNELDLHSIEQPIKAKQWEVMRDLCEASPLPIALDEELIGVFSKSKKETLLKIIKPQYIILKPSLIGGYQGTQDWIELAEENNIGWWLTSALESNVGLNAIAQYTYMLNTNMPQGLGTGSLYTNNIPCPLTLKGDQLQYNPELSWEINI